MEFVGEVGGRAQERAIARRAGLVFPIEWPEPFGLVMIEALACGTPVIGWRKGSVPEIIEDGITGFVVDNVEDATACVGRISEIRRSDCRRAFEERFDSRRMALDYVTVYRRLIDNFTAGMRLPDSYRDLYEPQPGRSLLNA